MKETKEMRWWAPHPLDKWGQVFLMEIAESAAPPDSQPSDSDDWCGEVTLPAKDGWKVCVFYDCGDLDYIDHFVTPDGVKLKVFGVGYKGGHWPPVMLWRGVSDTNRLKEAMLEYSLRPKPRRKNNRHSQEKNEP